MIAFGKTFACGTHDGAMVHNFIETRNPHSGLYTVMLQRHSGPCTCSFCNKNPHNIGYRRPFGISIKPRGNGWNMIHWATPWARWYLRWVRRGNW